MTDKGTTSDLPDTMVCPDCGFLWNPQELAEVIQGGGDIVGLLEMWRQRHVNEIGMLDTDGEIVTFPTSVPPFDTSEGDDDSEMGENALAGLMVDVAPVFEAYAEKFGPASVVAFLVNAGMGFAAVNGLTEADLAAAGVPTQEVPQ